MKLIVFIRNDAPLIFSGDSPTYRTVTLLLTDKQVKMLTPKVIYVNNEQKTYEEVSQIFLEPVVQPTQKVESTEPLIPELKLTVVLHDGSPILYGYDSRPRYRVVSFNLTPEQNRLLTLKFIGKNWRGCFHEEISSCDLDMGELK